MVVIKPFQSQKPRASVYTYRVASVEDVIKIVNNFMSFHLELYTANILLHLYNSFVHNRYTLNNKILTKTHKLYIEIIWLIKNLAPPQGFLPFAYYTACKMICKIFWHGQHNIKKSSNFYDVLHYLGSQDISKQSMENKRARSEAMTNKTISLYCWQDTTSEEKILRSHNFIVHIF